jgi:predicted GNAT family acetyltransferase
MLFVVQRRPESESGTGMDIDLDDLIVRDNTSPDRYKARVDGHVAFITDACAPGQITFIYPVKPLGLAGHGIAGKMACTVLKEARVAGLAVIPRCPFVAAYIQRRPEYIDPVPTDERAIWAGRHADRAPYSTL